MKQTSAFITVSLLAFALGFEARSLAKAEKERHQNQQGAPNAPGTPANPPCTPPNDLPNLIDDNHITEFNGSKLELHYDYGLTEDEISFLVDRAKIVGLDDGGLLVNLADTLYRLDEQRRVVWTKSTAQIIYDYTYVASSRLIYGTAGDNIMFVLDAATGEVKAGESRNGSAAFGMTLNYGNDMCLVQDNFVIYRERSRGYREKPMNDGISLWRGVTKLWNRDFPPDAEIVVAGDRILAVTKSKKAIYVNEIVPPNP